MSDRIKSWVDKYRPMKFEDVAGHEEIVASLSEMAKSGLVTHMLFSGDAGTGKTTLAEIFSRELLGTGFRSNYEKIDSSTDRGIDVVREDIKGIASTEPIGSDYKIIFLDEVDGMTSAAQHSLRATMEDFQEHCIFIMTCNYPNKVIDAVRKSRCAHIRFSPVDKKSMKKRLVYIVEEEKKVIHEDIVDAVVDYAQSVNGDMRAAINKLQISVLMSEAGVEKDVIVDGLVGLDSVSDRVEKMIYFATKSNFTRANKIMNELFSRGGNIDEILEQICEFVYSADGLDNRQSSDILNACALASNSCNMGGSPRVQLSNVLMKFALSDSDIRKESKSSPFSKKDVFSDDTKKLSKSDIMKDVEGESSGAKKVKLGTKGLKL